MVLQHISVWLYRGDQARIIPDVDMAMAVRLLFMATKITRP
jgi:hypothetical protein